MSSTASGYYIESNLTTDSSSETYYDFENETFMDYIHAYDYFDSSDRMNHVLRTPHKIGPLILGTVAISANLLCIAAIFQVCEYLF